MCLSRRYVQGLGIQYISHGWSFVNNLIAEYNTVNPDSGYQTGTILRDEASLTKTFGRLTLGPSLGWIGQITNDTSSRFLQFRDQHQPLQSGRRRRLHRL